MDTGNSLKDAIAITHELAREMNLVWEPQPQRRVGTAKKGTQLKILGLTQPILMKLGNLP